MSSNHRAKVQSRHEAFSEKIKTAITKEIVDPENPFLSTQQSWYGYDSVELAKNTDFVDTLFLLLTGNLPSVNQKELFNFVLVSLANPGPRHPAVRAGMSASIGKTLPEHFLPISLSVLGGNQGGAGEIQFVMRFLEAKLKKGSTDPLKEDSIPGFGTRYGMPDPYVKVLLDNIKTMPGAGAYIAWISEANDILLNKGQGLLSSGLCAAVFSDLGISFYQAAPLYQLICSPGIIAHSAEYAREPRTSLPFVPDTHYEIKK